MAGKPLLSIVVPVYNQEETLRRCLDTLVLQTLSPIEVIVVNDGSTDGSQSLIEEYERRFPETVRGIVKENGGLSSARNRGVSEAQAGYIGFVDSDDYVDYRYCELLYRKAVREKADIVYAPYYRVIGQWAGVRGMPAGKKGAASALQSQEFTVWSRIYKKELLQRYGLFPTMWYEDVASMPAILSLTERQTYLKKPLYYYIQRETSITASERDPRTLDTIRAEEMAISGCAAPYREIILVRMAKRMVKNIFVRWYYADRFIEQLRSYGPELLQCKQLAPYKQLLKTISGYLALSGETIPAHVFLYGFTDIPADTAPVFRAPGRVTVLSVPLAEASAVPAVKAAMQRGDRDSAAGYLALRHIFEEGGIYLGREVEPLAAFDCLKYYPAFFGYDSSDGFTDRIFGGRKENPLIGEILSLFEKRVVWTLRECIRCVLAVHGVPLKACTNYLDYPVAVLAPQVLVAGCGNFALSRYSTLGPAEYRALLELLALPDASPGPAGMAGLKKNLSAVEADRERYRRSFQKFRRTAVYRFYQKFRRVAGSVCRRLGG